MKKTVDFIVIIFMLILISTAVCFADEELSKKQKQDLVKSYYEVAVTCYQQCDYGKAIHYWEQILKLDPEQIQPPRLIEIARKQLLQANAELFSKIEEAYSNGEYEEALEMSKKALETDPQNAELQRLRNKLETVAGIFGDCIGKDEISYLMRVAAGNYLRPDGKIKSSVNAAIYGLQLAPKNTNISKFMDCLKREHLQDVKNVETIKGMNLVEQKLVAALNYIYDSKYDRAIVECNDVLVLEPKNVLALKRLGSSYYALGKEQHAKRIWRQAFKLAPKDEELKMFLKK